MADDKETPMTDRSKTDPFGVTFHIVASKHFPGLFEIVGDNPKKSKPQALAGHYTNKDKASAAIHAYLSGAWVYSDAEAEKLAKRAGRKPEKVELDATAGNG
jgi:hypothetical protein